MDIASAARAFRVFGEIAGPDSPLYARVCELIAESPELLALAARAPEGTPNILLAEARDGAPAHFALSAGRPGALVQRRRMGHHGGWLEWF